MPQSFPIPRKQRTRQHVIADLSFNYVERFILNAGHTVQRLIPDYGYDLLLFTYDDQGYIEPGLILLQLKASQTLGQSGADYVFDLDIRDYNLWTMNRMPVILVLFAGCQRRAYWLHIQGYFQTDPARRPKASAKTIRVRIPSRQAVNRRSIARMRALKQGAVERGRKEIEA